MEKINKQRKEYLNWDQYFMGVAKLSALRSKDPSTQVGACIVGDDNRILSIGYNGTPNGFSDDIKEASRIVDKKLILDDDQKELLDKKLQFILNNKNNLSVAITYFIKDKKKKGGAYYKIKAIITKINIVEGFITLSNKEKIKLDDIYSIEI